MNDFEIEDQALSSVLLPLELAALFRQAQAEGFTGSTTQHWVGGRIHDVEQRRVLHLTRKRKLTGETSTA